MRDKVHLTRHTPVLRIFAVIGIGWTIVIASILTWDVVNIKRQTTAVALSQARSFFKQVVTTRYWNAMQGGVYVPVTEKNKPNPYLKVPNRDIKTQNGRLLTLINPSYMTRQLAEIASKRNQVQFHITSLNPIRPGNAPAQWEIEALKSFLPEVKEYYKWEIDNKVKGSFRYMAPLWVERPCLKCHGKQGYSKGDLRGGISVSIPSDSILASRDKYIKFMISAYLSIWILGISGIVASFRFINSSIDQRERLVKQMLESEEKYRSMMESMKDAVYICSPELRIEYMNPAMIDRVGRDATGEICHKAIYDMDEKCSWCVFDQVQQKEHVEYEMADPKDNRYYSIINSPISHTDGTVSKLTILHDITEIKTIEEKLRQAHKMESIGTLTGGIAHDFNNILGIIVGNTELALDDVPEWNPAHSNLEEIKTACLRAANIVKQLRSFSRRTDPKLQPIEIVLVIKDALKFLRSTIPTTIDIQQDIQATDETILADPTQINQIMMNLCINASQAMEQTGGNLTVNVEKVILDDNSAKNYPDLRSGKHVKVTVSDTGPGIDPEIIDRIFDPYFTTKEVGKGSGMGLAVVLGIVKNHNGAIAVDCKPGKGTTFSILFPAATRKTRD